MSVLKKFTTYITDYNEGLGRKATAQFFGGHPDHEKPASVLIETGKNELIVKKGFNKKIFEISYKSIKSIESDTAERVGLTRLIALGLFAFVFKKTDKFLKITYKDDSGLDVTIVFGKLKADEWKGLILKAMKHK